MMLLCLQVLLIIGLLGFTSASGGEVNSFLARSIYVPKHDLLGLISENVFSTSEIYAPLSSSCFHANPAHQSHKYFSFYRDTASFYSSITTSTSLDASLESDFSLQTTLKVQSKNVAGSKNTVTGNSLVIFAKSMSFAVEKSCLLDDEAFTKNFLADLRLLPTKIDSPWLETSWRSYDVFLSKYGSHILTQITTGSEIDQRSFATSSESYSERDFEVKSCVGLAGPTDIGELGVDICANVTDEEKKRVSKLTMTTTLTVNGGTAATRNKLVTKRTKELIEEFLNEANKTDDPIRYTLTPIWDIIKQSYIGRSDNFIRGITMELYYLGFLNYGCPFKSSGGQNLQQFTLTKSSTPENPDYECTLATEGCHSLDDCNNHYALWCGCEGDSCVRYKTTTLDTGKTKTSAYINHDEWGWHGCDWLAVGIYCYCSNPETPRVKVWPVKSGQQEILYQAHNELLKCHGKVEEEFRNKEDL